MFFASVNGFPPQIESFVFNDDDTDADDDEDDETAATTPPVPSTANSLTAMIDADTRIKLEALLANAGMSGPTYRRVCARVHFSLSKAWSRSRAISSRTRKSCSR